MKFITLLVVASTIVLLPLCCASCADTGNAAFQAATGSGIVAPVISPNFGAAPTSSSVSGMNRFQMQSNMHDGFYGGAR